MLQGNRKLAAIIGALVCVTVTAALTATLGIPVEVALSAMAAQGTLGAGGALLGSDVDAVPWSEFDKFRRDLEAK